MKEITVYQFFYKQKLIYIESNIPFWTPEYIRKAKDFLMFPGSQKRYISSICVNKTFPLHVWFI